MVTSLFLFPNFQFRFSQLDTEYLLQWEAESESDVSEWVILVSSQSEAGIYQSEASIT